MAWGAGEAAEHVCGMCCRAFYCCPTVDITFGDYLRAVITADLDAVKNDRLGYRTAFMEAFRKWNILPAEMRTVSEQTLAWNRPDDASPAWLQDMIDPDGAQHDSESVGGDKIAIEATRGR